MARFSFATFLNILVISPFFETTATKMDSPASYSFLETQAVSIDVTVAAREIYIKHFDVPSQMATFSIEDLNDLNTGHQECLIISDMVRESLNLYVELGAVLQLDVDWDKTACSLSGWTNQIGIAGSFPLRLLESIVKRSYEDSLRGRWEASNMEWRCGDVDLFVGGDIGNDADKFRTFAEEIARNISAVSGGTAIPAIHRQLRLSRYIALDRPVYIMDVIFMHLQPKLQIIQCPGLTTLSDIVDNFDIDVVKVMYNPLSGLIHAQAKTVKAICDGEATVKDFFLSKNYPRKAELPALFSTLRRMHKYGTRGYEFARYPRMLTLSDDGSEENSTQDDSDEEDSTQVSNNED